MGIVSDVDNAHKSAKNPSLLEKFLGVAVLNKKQSKHLRTKKKLEEQRYELKQYLMFTHGSKDGMTVSNGGTN